MLSAAFSLASFRLPNMDFLFMENKHVGKPEKQPSSRQLDNVPKAMSVPASVPVTFKRPYKDARLTYQEVEAWEDFLVCSNMGEEV